MPEIDNDLFELLSLVGLGLVVLVGLAVWDAIGKLRKTLEDAGAEWDRDGARRGAGTAPALAAAEAEMPDAAGGESTETRAGAVSKGPGVVPAAAVREEREPGAVAAPEHAPAAEADTGEETASARAEEPEPAAARAPATAAEPARAEEPAPAAVGAEPEPTPERVGTAGEPEPVGAAGQPESMGAAASAAAADQEKAQPAATAEAEPEEQPFERDGRWWFRRNDELLVYDEMSGQWEPAPHDAPATSSATQELPSTGGEAGAEAPEEAAQPGSFWKCPSCGAVNGSTATSCRMCFAARP